MYSPGKHPLYPYTEEDRVIVLQKVGITEKQLKNDIDAIKDWLQKLPHLAEIYIDDHLITLYIIMAKGSVEKAKQRLDFYFKERRNIPEFEYRVQVLENGIKPLWPFVVASAPKLYNGSRVTFAKIFDWDKYKMSDAVVNLGLVCDVRFYNDLTSDEIYVVNLENVTLAHLLTIDYITLSKAFWFIKKGFGLKIQAIHIINISAPTIMQAAINFLKLCLSDKIINRVVFHKSLEDLHEHVPKEYLPCDYGGYLPSCKEFQEKMESFYTEEKNKQFLFDKLKLVSDESKRPKSMYTEDYLPGNFRKLEVD